MIHGSKDTLFSSLEKFTHSRVRSAEQGRSGILQTPAQRTSSDVKQKRTTLGPPLSGPPSAQRTCDFSKPQVCDRPCDFTPLSPKNDSRHHIQAYNHHIFNYTPQKHHLTHY